MTKTADPERLAQIETRLKAITPGEWRIEEHRSGTWIVATGKIYIARVQQHIPAQTGSDAEFIAKAPADIAWLLSRLSSVEAERDTLAASLAAACEALRPFGRHANATSLSEALGHITREDLQRALALSVAST